MLTNAVGPTDTRRREGQFRALQGGDDAVVAQASATYDGGYQAMQQIMAEHPATEGIFAYNDLMAIGAIAAARDAGASVPDDFAVIGCDDIDMSARVSPKLTTVRLDRERLGAEAVARLVELHGTGAGPKQVTLPVSLMVRESA